MLACLLRQIAILPLVLPVPEPPGPRLPVLGFIREIEVAAALPTTLKTGDKVEVVLSREEFPHLTDEQLELAREYKAFCTAHPFACCGPIGLVKEPANLHLGPRRLRSTTLQSHVNSVREGVNSNRAEPGEIDRHELGKLTKLPLSRRSALKPFDVAAAPVKRPEPAERFDIMAIDTSRWDCVVHDTPAAVVAKALRSAFQAPPVLGEYRPEFVAFALSRNPLLIQPPVERLPPSLRTGEVVELVFPVEEYPHLFERQADRLYGPIIKRGGSVTLIETGKHQASRVAAAEDAKYGYRRLRQTMILTSVPTITSPSNPPAIYEE